MKEANGGTKEKPDKWANFNSDVNETTGIMLSSNFSSAIHNQHIDFPK